MLKKFFKTNFLLIIILIIAAFLRLYHIGDYMEFLGDQGRDVTIIRDFLKNGNIFFIGPQTSIGNMYLGPYFYYLITPFLWVSNYSPVGPAVFIALINIATVFLIYYVGKSWFNKKTGLVAAFLFSISPVVIRYSNFIWNPNIMPFFALLLVFLFFQAIRKEDYRYFIYATLAFVMVINSHYLGLALLPFIGIYWLLQLIKYLKVKSKNTKSFIIYSIFSLLVFIISLTPQILFEFKHGFQNSKALISFFTYRETTVNIKAYKAVPYIGPLFNQVNTRLLAGKDEAAGVVVSIIFILGIVYLLVKPDKKYQKYFLLTVFWLFSGLASLALYKQHIYDHYFGFLFPVIFVLIAYLIHRTKIIGIFLLLLIVFFSFREIPLRWAPNHQLYTTQSIVDSIIADANRQDFNFAVLSKMGYGFSYYIVENENYFDTKDKITEQLYVVCVPFQIDCNPINNPQWEIASFGWAKIDKEWEIDNIKIFKLVHNKPL